MDISLIPTSVEVGSSTSKKVKPVTEEDREKNQNLKSFKNLMEYIMIRSKPSERTVTLNPYSTAITMPFIQLPKECGQNNFSIRSCTKK